MPRELVLDLDDGDVLPAADDDVLAAPDDAHAAVPGGAPEVASIDPAVSRLHLGGEIRLPVVADADAGAAHLEAAGLVRRYRLQLFVDDA